MALASGSRLGPYEVKGLLGAGGMGEVYEARDPRLDRLVALKVLAGDLATDPDRLSRFEREAKAVAALNHPNIVTLYGIEESDGVRFLAMERIQGESLASLIEPGGLPLRKILDWAIPIADALAAAHAHGVVHRDLKPGNVMINDEGRPKILDFGLARVSAPSSSPVHAESVTEALTTQGAVFGTVPYMAPEQLKGGRADAQADLFAFGAILYEMASGRRPFTGATGAEVAAAILTRDPERLEGIRTDLPATFVRIVGHCLEKDPNRRIQSAADLRHALSDLADEVRTRSGAVAIASPAKAPSAKRRWVSISAFASVVLALASAVVFLKPFGSKPALAKPIQSLAVLPLKNYSGDASQDYFADGMTDALISNLAQIRALKVISRQSAMKYRDSKKTTGEIAKELGVEGIVEGSVMRSGSRVKVEARLVNAGQDRNIWASNYEREMRDILSLQSEVVRAIAGEIRVQVTPLEQERLGASRAVDPVVYDTTVRAQTIFERATGTNGWRRAMAMFQAAVDKDPGHAPAWAGLSMSTISLGALGIESVPPNEVAGPALAAVEKALALNPDLPEAHWARALVAANSTEWNFALAQTHYERALELRPGYAACHNDYGQFLIGLQDFEKARIHLDRARELDPFSTYNSMNRIWYLAAQGHAEQAVEEGRRFFRAEPDNGSIPFNLGYANLRLGKFQEAARDFESLLGPSRFPSILGPLGLAYGRAGDREKARKILAEMEEASGRRYVSPFLKAFVHMGLGQSDEAFRLLERALEVRVPSLPWYSIPSALDICFEDPRWPAFQARVRQAVRWPPDSGKGGLR